jgi:hypothetical protein
MRVSDLASVFLTLHPSNSDRDTTLITYNWVRGKRAPTANFNVARRCADWGSMEEWALQHEVKDVPTKPADALELPRIP